MSQAVGIRERIKQTWEKEIVERFREGLKSLDIILWIAIAINAGILLIAFWNQIIATIGINGAYFLIGAGTCLFFFLLFTGEELFLVETVFSDVVDPIKQHLGFLPFWRKPYQDANGRTCIKVGICPKHELCLLWGDWKPPYVVRSFILTKIYGKIEKVEKRGFWSKKIYIAPVFPKKIAVPIKKKMKIKSVNPGEKKEVEVIEGYEEVDFNPGMILSELKIAAATSQAYEQTVEKLRKEVENLRKETANVYERVAESSAVVRDTGIQSQKAFISHMKDGWEIASELLDISVYSLKTLLGEMRETIEEFKALREEMMKMRTPMIMEEKEEEGKKRRRRRKGSEEE